MESGNCGVMEIIYIFEMVLKVFFVLLGRLVK